MKEFFDRYKVVIFLICALAAGLAFAILPFELWKFIVYIPIAALGVFLLVKLFPRSSDEHLTVVRVNGDGSVLITKSAVARSAADAVKVIQEVKYLGCDVENSRSGINILINVKVLGARVVETSEVVKEFVKNLLEEELNVKVNKIDIVVKKVQYALKVRKIDPSNPEAAAQDEEEDSARKSKTNKAIERAGSADKIMVPVSEFNSEYDFAVGNEKKRVVVKGGDDAARQKMAVKPPVAATPADNSAVKYSVPPVSAPVYSASAPKPAASYPVTPKTTATTSPVTQTVPTQIPAEHPPIDLKAELAKRKAEREALLNKISSDGNKLN